jgi:hypothetical protein
LVNTAYSDSSDIAKSSVSSTSSSISLADPMTRLIEMGFANRAKNQRILQANGNDLAKVIALLSMDSVDDPDWFEHRH